MTRLNHFTNLTSVKRWDIAIGIRLEVENDSLTTPRKQNFPANLLCVADWFWCRLCPCFDQEKIFI